MLKLRIILMSALILLVVGLDMNVRAALDSKKLVQKTADKDESEKESDHHNSKETISSIDFFGAFSLVNVQLQWRDLHIVLKDELGNSTASVNPTGLSIEEVETLTLEVADQSVPTSPVITNSLSVFPIGTYRDIDGTTHFSCYHNKQTLSTITYILNCATHPTSC